MAGPSPAEGSIGTFFSVCATARRRDKPGHDGDKIPFMRVLAIDTALEACAVAVLSEHGVVSRSVPMVRGHAEALMPLVAKVMGEASTEFVEVDRIVVTTGPGSFTGLRVGI